MASNDAIEAREQAQYRRELARPRYTEWLLSETDFRSYLPMHVANDALTRYQWTRTVDGVNYYDVFTRKVRDDDN